MDLLSVVVDRPVGVELHLRVEHFLAVAVSFGTSLGDGYEADDEGEDDGENDADPWVLAYEFVYRPADVLDDAPVVIAYEDYGTGDCDVLVLFHSSFFFYCVKIFLLPSSAWKTQ